MAFVAPDPVFSASEPIRTLALDWSNAGHVVAKPLIDLRIIHSPPKAAASGEAARVWALGVATGNY